MNRDTEVDFIRRLLAHVDARGTDRGDSERTVPATDYLDAGQFGVEMAAIFHRQPVVIAHASQLARPGDYLTESVLGIPVAVVRDDNGRLGAYVNVCRHRAAQLLTCDAGSGLRAIVCPYHAWSYDLSGRLTTIPDQEGSFPSVDPGSLGLVRLPVAERHGFVWIGLTPDTDLDVAGFLGPLDDELANLELDSYTFYTGETRTWRFNWKTGVEAFLENYHFATLHKRSTSRIFLNNLTVLNTYGPHILAVAPKRSLGTLRDVPEADWTLRPHATLLYVIFPNSCLFVEKTHASLLRVVPAGPTSSSVRISHIVGRDGLRYRDYWDRNLALFTSAVLEDLDMCESMTTGLAALPDQRIVFGRNEVGCTAFRDAVRLAVTEHELDQNEQAATGGHTPARPFGVRGGA